MNVDGIGLGLVISKMIVNKFNGEINFMSKYKKGSTFFFTFEHESFSSDDFKKQIDKPGDSNNFVPTYQTV